MTGNRRQPGLPGIAQPVEKARSISRCDVTYASHKEYARPRTRGDCASVPRPCPFVACRHHLAIDETGTKYVKLNHPDTEVSDLWQSCALDVAETGGVTQPEIAQLLNISVQRVSHIEASAMQRFKDKWRRMFGSASPLGGEEE